MKELFFCENDNYISLAENLVVLSFMTFYEKIKSHNKKSKLTIYSNSKKKRNKTIN